MDAAPPHPLVWVGFAAFFVVALAVGSRLLLLARRTRRLPELCIGAGVLGIGPVGFGFYVIAEELAPPSPALHGALVGVGMLAIGLGVFCKFVFNWRVYHPARRRVRALVAGAAATLALTWAYSAATGFAGYNDVGWSYLARIALQIGALLWGSAEALRYWSRMRRRVRLGMGDPVVCNRFLLWGIGAGAAGVGSLVGTLAQIATGVPANEVPWVLASSSLHGLVAAAAMWLAFLPPAAYTRLVERRARVEA